MLLVLSPGPSLAQPEVRSEPTIRVRALPVPATGTPGFTRLGPEVTGIMFTNGVTDARSLTNHILLNGSGVALGDFDGDGLPDIYLCRLTGANALYHNEGGFRFREVTPEVLACRDMDSTGAAFADVDGDGDPDLLVNGLGRGTRCFLNDGQGVFREHTAEAGTASAAGATSLALADVDGDGDLDLYVAHYRTSTIRDHFDARLRVNRIDGRLTVTAYEGHSTDEPDLVGRFSIDPSGHLMENGEADALFLNDGHGRFHPVPFTAGAFLDEEGQSLRQPPYDWSLSAMFRDLNGDGWPDLYVCSDMDSPDRIWINQRDGRFRALSRLAVRKSSWFSMGVDFGDLNRDGLDDFFVTDMLSRDHRLRQVEISNHKAVESRPGTFDDRPQVPRNTLFLNLGDGDFAEVAYAASLQASDWSWAPVFLDVDLDGYEDILVVTGFERDVQDIDVANQLEAARQGQHLSESQALALRKQFPPLLQANLAFRNRGHLSFEETGTRWGFDEVGISQGIAMADLDGDGDLDLAVNDLEGAAGVYRNNSAAPRVAVRLLGSPPNTAGIGARIRLFGGAVPEQSQEMIAGGRYLSGDEPLRVFAAGSLTNRMRLEVDWRSGRQGVLHDVRPNQLYAIREADAGPPARRLPPREEPLFADVTDRLDHTHVEDAFDDRIRQTLLPRRLSQAGPAVAWHDLDGDGWPDLAIGTGRGGPMGLFRNDTHGGFSAYPGAPTRVISRDLSGVLIQEAEGACRILAGFSNYEGGPGEPGSVVELSPGSSEVRDAIPPIPDEPGPLALADMDGDGDLDLFVGGRVIPGRYPEPASSRIYRREQDAWRLDPSNLDALSGAGLVNGAVFTDLDGDGRPELVLASDWGPLRVFRNSPPGHLRDVTVEWGFDQLPGWWQGVTAGDFDGDGRMDLVASNWGTNTRYGDPRRQPRYLYFGDFNGGGSVDVLEAYRDSATGAIVPLQHLGRARQAFPFLQETFHTYHEFAAADVPGILGNRASLARTRTVTWPLSTVFLNRGDRFEPRPLPPEAQYAPAFATVVADFDGDGKEDVFLSQNFFATDSEDDRHDGGRGLLLRGDGSGGFVPMPARDSGLRIYGEQRGAATADFDRDGRADLVVTQNGARTRLFRNDRGSPGLRVSLKGPRGNPDAIGAVVRLDFGDHLGSARELHGGSGYLSQDDSTLVLGTPQPARAVWVRWPDGRETRTPIPKGSVLRIVVSAGPPGGAHERSDRK